MRTAERAEAPSLASVRNEGTIGVRGGNVDIEAPARISKRLALKNPHNNDGNATLSTRQI
jgi:hypothetical protein